MSIPSLPTGGPRKIPEKPEAPKTPKSSETAKTDAKIAEVQGVVTPQTGKSPAPLTERRASQTLNKELSEDDQITKALNALLEELEEPTTPAKEAKPAPPPKPTAPKPGLPQTSALPKSTSPKPTLGYTLPEGLVDEAEWEREQREETLIKEGAHTEKYAEKYNAVVVVETVLKQKKLTPSYAKYVFNSAKYLVSNKEPAAARELMSLLEQTIKDKYNLSIKQFFKYHELREKPLVGRMLAGCYKAGCRAQAHFSKLIQPKSKVAKPPPKAKASAASKGSKKT